VADGEMTEKQRNTLLPQMTDDVAAQVLADNYFQTQIISLTRRLGTAQLDRQARFMRHLEKSGLLDRAIEFLPDDEQIAERKARGQGLTSPELAVLLAYSKMWLSDELVASDLPEDPWVAGALQRYFPPLLREKFAAYIDRHPLKREIVATHVLNRMVNRVGPTFVHRLTETTGATPAQIVRAWLVARQVFCYGALWKRIEALDNRVPDEVQAQMAQHMRRPSVRATTWLLHPKRRAESLQAQIERLTPAVALLRARLEPAVAGTPLVAAWVGAGVPADLAQAVAATDALFDALDIAEIAESTGQPLEQVCELHRELGTRLGLPRVHAQIEGLSADGHWDTLAKISLGDELADLQRQLALQVLNCAEGDATQRLQAWEVRNQQALQGAQRLLAELADAKAPDLAMLSVALRKLRHLV
jgi:glutamate dehydrogenase